MPIDNRALPGVRIYFTDFFDVDPERLEEYGAFNVSCLVDLPLFIDPFLLFTSEKAEYKVLHDEIVRYLKFLRDRSVAGGMNDGLLKAWFCFPEVHQNRLGFCATGNRGNGLGMTFARALNENLNALFTDFGNEKVTLGSHLEKFTLIKQGVGRDTISDFTTNLIKGFLLRYTEQFSKQYIDPSKLRQVNVSNVIFDYEREVWRSGLYTLPWFGDDFVLLTPENILTKDDVWINKHDLRHDFSRIAAAMENVELRAQVDNYFRGVLPRNPTAKDEARAIEQTLVKFPALIDYYIRAKEERGAEAVEQASRRVQEVDNRFVQNLGALVRLLNQNSPFYSYIETTLEETRRKILYLKDVIENRDGYKIFYVKGKAVEREADLQLIFKLVWEGSPSSVDSEVNNGRGPVDFKVSRGASDSTLVEFKLASNSSLQRNLERQVEIYKQANNTVKAFKVVMFFDELQAAKLRAILRALNVEGDPGIIQIDARRDNKPSASKA